MQAAIQKISMFKNFNYLETKTLYQS